ncbi:MAG: hypothetical protein II966_03350 [Lachnospiraceae bacterium]|nr:hypothetical protein [Lachnospiraceae bacterium]
MSDAYMSMMIASQEKKLGLLERAIELDREQEEIITGEAPDMGALDANLNAKGALVDELNKLDDGFETLYAKVREEFIANKDQHKEEIRRLQELIRLITAKTAEIEAIEARSKINFENFMKKRRNAVREARSSVRAASVYAGNMRKVNRIDSMFVDNKK